MTDDDGDDERQPEPEPESLEEKLRAVARDVSESVDRVAGRLDLDEIADQIKLGGERFRELAEFAGQWLDGQLHGAQDPGSASTDRESGGRRLGPTGPDPRDLPTEEQGLALSALESGRWRVEPGTNQVAVDGDGPDPGERADVVGELRARDWIAASGEVTVIGRDALRRWLDSISRS